MQVKLLGLIVLLSLSGCYSNNKQSVIVVEKSNNLENVQQSRFASTPNQTKTVKRTTNSKPKKVTKPGKSWSIPVTGKIIKTFSKQHQGLTFNTKSGQKVRAIRDGKVVYVGDKMKSHGKMIIIRHPLGFYSSYTQNKELMVANGDSVSKGQVISTTSTTPFYFEMKKFKQTINPLKYLK